MNIGEMLFNPNGRMNSAAFWRGYIIILGAALILNVVVYFLGPTSIISTLLGFAGLVFYWNTIAVFVKRLHDSGASGWWTAAIAFGWFIAALVIVIFVIMTFAGEVFQTAMDDPSYAQSPQFGLDFQERAFVPMTAAVLALNIVLGFIMANLRSDPNTNQYGPPEGGGMNDVF